MPINLSCPTYYRGRRLSFGVPLEDIFSPREIHPGLKNLFVQSYENIVNKGYPVTEVLSYGQGSLHERLTLKEKIVLSKEIKDIKASPGALLWVIRHFIGLVPVQLMPRRIGDQKYFWWKITKECRKCLGSYTTRGKNDNKFLYKLAGELLRLPPHNFLLLATLLNFLRMLAVLPGGEPRINKYSTFALVKYFSSSVFIRPFRPGCVTKVDKQYYPLMLYLVLKWSDIRKICVETSNYSFELPLEEIYPEYSSSLEYPHYLSKRCSDGTTQTNFLPKPELEQQEALIRIVPPSYDDFDFLKDVGCQTETNLLENLRAKVREVNRKSCCCCLLGSHYERFVKKQTPLESSERNVPFEIGNTVIFVRKDCCCLYSTNHETNTELTEDFKSSPELVKQYGWNTSTGECQSENTDPSLSNDVQDTNSLGFSTTSNLSSNYENYSPSNLIGELESMENNSYKDIKTFDPIKKEEKHVLNEALKEKIMKMGWSLPSPPTHTSSEKLLENEETNNDDQPSKPQIGWKIPQGNLCKSDRELRKSLNKELKEKLSKMKLKSKCEREGFSSSTDEVQSPGDHKELKVISAKPTESKKSLINVSKIKSRLNFLRIFKPKKMRPKKSYSYEQVNSGVKYEKIGSASSIL